MTDMIEKVARALHQDGVDNPDWKAWVPQARAAIAAMREPTDEMKSAGDSMMPHFADTAGTFVTGYDVAGEVWTAMADAALGKNGE